MATILDTVGFPMLTAALPALSGKIDAIWIRVDGVSTKIYDGATLAKNSAQVNVGKQVSFIVQWSNRAASGNLKGYLAFNFTPPGGSPQALSYLNQSLYGIVAAPQQYWIVEFNPVTIPAEGDYAGDVTFSGEAG